MSNVLEVCDVRKNYPTSGQDVHALNGVSFEVRAGEMVTLMGASGSGKSTLLHLMAGLDQPTAGSIRIDGADIGRMTDRARTLFRRRHIGIIFQGYNLLPTLTALENVKLPALIDRRDSRAVDERALMLLDLVGLQQRVGHRPDALSGGEQQRVAIARALINEPALILADEPTGNLDAEHSEAVWRQLAALVHDGGCTVVAVTHEPTGATFADRVVVLKDGRIVGQMNPEGEDHASLVAARYTELVR